MVVRERMAEAVHVPVLAYRLVLARFAFRVDAHSAVESSIKRALFQDADHMASRLAVFAEHEEAFAVRSPLS